MLMLECNRSRAEHGLRNVRGLHSDNGAYIVIMGLAMGFITWPLKGRIMVPTTGAGQTFESVWCCHRCRCFPSRKC